MFRLKPSEIMFSQDSINNYFDKRSQHNGVLIGETLDDICEGRCSVYDLPTINVMKRDGKWVTADNRRLWVFRQLERLGKCDGILVRETFYIDPAKLNSYNGGMSVRVRRYAGGRWHNKPSVTRPAPKVNVAINFSPKYETHRKPVVKPSVTNTLNSITSTSTANTGHSTYTYSRPSSGTALNKTISSVKNEFQPSPYRINRPNVTTTGASRCSAAELPSKTIAESYGRTVSFPLDTEAGSLRSQRIYSAISNREPSIYHNRAAANFCLANQNVQGTTATGSSRNDSVYPSSRAFDRRVDGFLDHESLRENAAQMDRKDAVRVDMHDSQLEPANFCSGNRTVQGTTATRSTRNASVYPSSRAFDRRVDGFLDHESLRENAAQMDRQDAVRVDMHDSQPLLEPGGSCPCVIL